MTCTQQKQRWQTWILSVFITLKKEQSVPSLITCTQQKQKWQTWILSVFITLKKEQSVPSLMTYFYFARIVHM